jgi:DNA invertase Pin-like site-specific DNA recombinase
MKRKAKSHSAGSLILRALNRKSAIIYACVSSKEQERDGYSIDAQLKLLRKFAREKGYRIAQEFVEAESAKGTGRKIFYEMLAFLKVNPQIVYPLCQETALRRLKRETNSGRRRIEIYERASGGLRISDRVPNILKGV